MNGGGIQKSKVQVRVNSASAGNAQLEGFDLNVTNVTTGDVVLPWARMPKGGTARPLEIEHGTDLHLIDVRGPLDQSAPNHQNVGTQQAFRPDRDFDLEVFVHDLNNLPGSQCGVTNLPQGRGIRHDLAPVDVVVRAVDASGNVLSGYECRPAFHDLREVFDWKPVLVPCGLHAMLPWGNWNYAFWMRDAATGAEISFKHQKLDCGQFNAVDVVVT